MQIILVRFFSIHILVLFSFYFVSYIVFPNTLFSKKYLLLGISLFLVIILSAIIRYYFLLFLYSFYLPNLSKPIFLHNTVQSIYSFQISASLAFPYSLLKQFIENEKKETLIQKKRNLLTKSVLNADLLGLKNQINPHFIYNILNFFYAQSLPLNSKLSKSIIALSDMMRYAIRENEEGKSSLEKEIAYVKNYVLLENLQFGTEKAINLEVTGNLKYRRITPLIFQPLLDHCCKFGENIKILIVARENQVIFSSEYKKRENIEMNLMEESFNIIKSRMNDNELSMNFNPYQKFCNMKLLLNL